MSNQNFVSATTRAIYKLRTPDDKPITMKELIDMCGLYANPDQPTATFEIVKLYEAPTAAFRSSPTAPSAPSSLTW